VLFNLEITSKICIVAMFVVNLQTIFHACFMGKFMFNIHTKFCAPSPNGPLVIAVKLRAKLKFPHGYHAVVYTIQKNSRNKSRIFFEALLSYIISAPYMKCR
jgi:hypothetical protein